MAQAEAIKPSHRAIQRYYDSLKAFDGQHVEHESAVRSAFQNLLAETAKARDWVLIPELTHNTGGGGGGAAHRDVRPDATVRDQNSLPRGYWEAKDSADSLDAEIEKKKAKGYPLSNILFEDTRTAVLYQNKFEVLRVDLHNREKVADLLNRFYSYAEPEIERFDHAVAEFKTRVPQLAGGLSELIKKAHGANKRFETAFGEFLVVC